MKLHIGCGSVYLTGWVNVDVPAPGTFLAGERPDLVARYATDDARYYARHAWADVAASIHAGARASAEYVCDRYGTWAALPCRPGEVTELLSRQTLEHLSVPEARAGLAEAFRALAPGGVLRLSVPDHEATLRRWRETGDDIYIRHLFGPRTLRAGYDRGCHVTSYTPDDLRALVAAAGFLDPRPDTDPHDYPAICLRWVRP